MKFLTMREQDELDSLRKETAGMKSIVCTRDGSSNISDHDELQVRRWMKEIKDRRKNGKLKQEPINF